jgi:hypothetical protein
MANVVGEGTAANDTPGVLRIAVARRPSVPVLIRALPVDVRGERKDAMIPGFLNRFEYCEVNRG